MINYQPIYNICQIMQTFYTQHIIVQLSNWFGLWFCLSNTVMVYNTNTTGIYLTHIKILYSQQQVL